MIFILGLACMKWNLCCCLTVQNCFQGTSLACLLPNYLQEGAIFFCPPKKCWNRRRSSQKARFCSFFLNYVILNKFCDFLWIMRFVTIFGHLCKIASLHNIRSPYKRKWQQQKHINWIMQIWFNTLLTVLSLSFWAAITL